MTRVSLLSLLLLVVLLPILSISSASSSLRSASFSLQSIRIQHVDVDTHRDIFIDTHTPHFSWQLPSSACSSSQSVVRGCTQSAYVLRVSSESPLNDRLMEWTSGTRETNSSILQYYTGPKLTSDTTYRWWLMVWTSSGTVSEWMSGTFHTALLNPAIDFQGSWIGHTMMNMNQLRRGFALPASPISQATLYIAGIGYYSLYINGQTIDPSRRLDPGWTTYQYRTLYTAFNVAAYLNSSLVNVVGVQLGAGWYSQQQWIDGLGARTELSRDYGPNRLLFQLNVVFRDGSGQSVVSDGSWLGSEGPHRTDGVYMGTFYDNRAARPQFSSRDYAPLADAAIQWTPAMVLPSPLEPTHGQLSLQMMDPVRIGPDSLHVKTSAKETGHDGRIVGVNGAPVTATSIKPIGQRSSNGQQFDLGQNMAGWCAFSGLQAPRGFSFIVRYTEYLVYAETIGVDNHSQDPYNLQYIAALDSFIFNGSGVASPTESFEPPYTYHGFRYVTITGYNNIDTSQVICYPAHSATTLIGNFTSDNTVINQLQHNIIWSQLSNSVSLPTDCPQRNERRGWMGDSGLSVDESLFNFDYVLFYQNFLQLVADNQYYLNGSLSDTVPFTVGTSPADPNWGTGYMQMVLAVYRHYGDFSIISTHYTNLKAWTEVVYNGYIQSGGLAHIHYNYGDWAAIGGPGANPELVASFPFLRDVHNLIDLATLMNDTVSVARYQKLYANLSAEFHSTFYNAGGKGYAEGSQTSNVLALTLPGVVPDSLRATVIQSLITSIQSTGYITCGIIGMDNLFPFLSSNGYHDLALQMISVTTNPSYGWTQSNPIQNATTVWEVIQFWSGHQDSSMNHHMFSSVGAWFYRYLAGIDLQGLEVINIYPRMSMDLSIVSHIEAEVNTIKGKIVVEWKRYKDHKDIPASTLYLSVTIPHQTTGLITLEPTVLRGRCHSLIESGTMMWKRGVDYSYAEKTEGIKALRENQQTGQMMVEVESGSYDFIVAWN